MQEPLGFLQTELIINVVSQFLPMADKSVFLTKINSECPPIGLYALVLTAVSCALNVLFVISTHVCRKVDRALNAYLPKGVFSVPDDFKHDFYWKQLQQFVRKVKIVGPSRWEEIFYATLDAPEADMGHAGDMSVISSYRDELYIPGSPVKRH
jgi:hypothetical protein